MKKSIYLLLAIFLSLTIFSYFKSRENQTELLVHDVPLPTTGEKNSEAVFVEPKYQTSSVEINYFENYNGYFVEPNENGEYPGIIMIHEWWGLNQNIKDMADQLASQGYRVLAVDLFGSSTNDPQTAREQTSSLNQYKAIQNMKAAYDYLNQKGSTKIGSLGWCFGGTQSLQISLNQQLDATVIYYGRLNYNENQIGNIGSPVLGIFGAEDSSIPLDTVDMFKNNLDSRNVENNIYVYPGVGHAFANPSGNNYSQTETIDAWNKTLNFLQKNLQNNE